MKFLIINTDEVKSKYHDVALNEWFKSSVLKWGLLPIVTHVCDILNFAMITPEDTLLDDVFKTLAELSEDWPNLPTGLQFAQAVVGLSCTDLIYWLQETRAEEELPSIDYSVFMRLISKASSILEIPDPSLKDAIPFKKKRHD